MPVEGQLVETTVPTLWSDDIDAKVEARGGDAAAMNTYAEAGIALSNKACSDCFASHHFAQERVQEEQSWLNVIVDAGIAIAGLAGAGANPMAITAAALGGVNAGYETFRTNHFLSGTIWKPESKVRARRTALAATLRQRVGQANYSRFRLEDDLPQFHNACSRLRLIALVEARVAATRFAPPAGADEAMILRAVPGN